MPNSEKQRGQKSIEPHKLTKHIIETFELPGKKALDLGCGWGGNASYLADNGF